MAKKSVIAGLRGHELKSLGTTELIVPFIAQFVAFHDFRRHLRSIVLLLKISDRRCDGTTLCLYITISRILSSLPGCHFIKTCEWLCFSQSVGVIQSKTLLRVFVVFPPFIPRRELKYRIHYCKNDQECLTTQNTGNTKNVKTSN